MERAEEALAVGVSSVRLAMGLLPFMHPGTEFPKEMLDLCAPSTLSASLSSGQDKNTGQAAV